MNEKLGTLERVELSMIWKDEAREFTPWLAEEENLELLAKALGMGGQLELVDMEAPVGRYKADVVCRNRANGAIVLIENQLTPTDHDHLGKMLTYAAGLHAKTIIWVAREFNEEHRAAIDWLNELTNWDVSFFGFQVELLQIDESRYAPDFKIVAKPNDWSRIVSMMLKNLTETEKLYLEYWESMKNYIDKKSYTDKSKPKLNMPPPLPYNFLYFGIGTSGVTLIASITSEKMYVGFETFDTEGDKYFYPLYNEQRDIINGEFKIDALEWDPKEGKKTCGVYCRCDASIENKKEWINYHKWMVDRMVELTEVFRPRVEAIKHNQKKGK